MCGAKFIDAVTTSHSGKLREAQLRRQARSQVQLGNASVWAVALPQLSPCIAPQQWCNARTPLMCRRIPPMLWGGYQPALDRVIVQIFQFLQHDLVTHDGLRMRAFLPNLMGAFELMCRAKISELIQEPLTSFRFQELQDLMRCMPLEMGDDARKIRRCEDGVKVVIEDNPTMNLQALVRAAILERLNENVAACGGGEDRQPRYDGRSDEMSGAKFIDAVTTSHSGKLREAQLRRQARSQVQLGNEGKQGEKRRLRQTPSLHSPFHYPSDLLTSWESR
jgi:hypothetical protein